MSEPLSLVFELARTDTPEDPYGFRFKPQDYTLRTTHGGRKRVHLAWSAEFLADLDALHASYCDPAVVQRVGRALCSFLEPSGWTWHAQAIAAATQRSLPVLLTVRSAAAELYTLPWELLPLEATGQCVGELPGLLIRYEWPETHTVPQKRAGDTSRRRLLVAWSAAAGEVPASEHVEAIGAACRAAGWDFKPSRDVIPHASLGKLADALDQANSEGTPVGALHLLCHAGRAGQTWGLMLNSEDAEDDGVAVDSWRLRQLLAPHADTLRLVVLAACGSAHGREFDSVAQALHRAGIQSVVASRFPLSVSGASRAAQILYDAALAQQTTLEEAFLLTRKQLARDAARLDWAGLQLYARGADGHETRPFRAPRPEATAAEGAPSGASRDDLERLDLPALLKLQTQVRGTLSSRFESQQALVCVELVDVDFRGGALESGLHKRCYGLLGEASMPHSGRIFATQGDSLHACYPSGKAALRVVLSFIDAVTDHNYRCPREDQIMVSIGLHWGTVLTNGRLVTGPSVDIVARIAEIAGRGRLLLSQHALNQIPRVTQALCTPVAESIGDGIELYSLPWGDERALACRVWIEESGEQLALPNQDVIAFGRLDALADGTRANDIVLTHPEQESQLAISRWHFELRRTRRGHMLRRVSSQLIEVDGRPIEPGEEVQVRPGTTVRLAQVMTLRFLGRERAHSSRDALTIQQGADLPASMVTLHEVVGSFEDTAGAGGGAAAANPARTP
ncbi:MAG TPA: CHAT domain-containing protein [Kofleriaceae bacterium]|nr:CHAT domain-containing protein [Kofleriaceae bacterium]